MAGQIKPLADFVACGGEQLNGVFGDVVEAFPVPIYTTDAQGRLTYFNAAAAKLSGRVPELGTDQWCVTWKLFLPDGTPLPHDQCPMAVALRGGAVSTGIECIAERPDGTRFWFTPCPSILRDTKGRIIGGMNLLVDITDRKNAEIEGHEKFRAIVGTTPECVKIVAPDGTLLFMNPAGLAMIGEPSAEAVTGKSVYSLIAPEDRDGFREFHERICQGEKGSMEFDITGLQGARRHMETYAAPLRYGDGVTVHLGLTRDITERKRVDEALRESEERFRRVFEEGPLGLALVGKDYGFLKVNSALCRMLGYSEAELTQMSFVDITYPDDLRPNLDLAGRLSRFEIPHFKMQKRYVKKTSEIIWVNLSASVLRGQGGEPLDALAIIEDITELKRTQEEALARQKLESLGVLAGGIAHDFNNLLGGILAEAELVEADLAAPREEIARIKSVVIRGAEIVRELMIYAGQGQTSLVEPLDLSRLVEEMLALLKVSVSKQVVVKIDLDKDLPAVWGNAPQLRQVVMNLVINASEAIGDKGGEIHVSTSRVTGRPGSTEKNGSNSPPGDYVRLEVSDTGCGMTDELRAKIFDPFFTTKFAGRGLGLAVVQGIVRDQEGALDVVSAPGRGTTFRVLLSCAAKRTAGVVLNAVTSSWAEPSSVRTGTILIVEDEEALLRPISKALRNRDFSVLEASDGSTAMDLLRAHKDEIDVILLDVTLPGRSSREVLEEALRLRPNLKVILNSAYSKEAVDASFAGLEIRYFIRKPFQLSELDGVLREAMAA